MFLVESSGDSRIFIENEHAFADYCADVLQEAAYVDGQDRDIEFPIFYSKDDVENFNFKGIMYYILTETFDDTKQMTSKLFKFGKKETGWIRSRKVDTISVLKEIKATYIPSYVPKYPVPVNSVNPVNLVNPAPKLTEVVTEVATEVANEYDVNQVSPVLYIREMIDKIENTAVIKERRRLVLQLIKYLTTPKGYTFLHSYPAFADVVDKKIQEFYYDNELLELKELYVKIYNRDIPSTVKYRKRTMK